MSVESPGSMVTLKVWNAQQISDEISCRIFQRHFSTKGGMGRGLGTFSAKLFTEKYLGGSLNFVTSPDAGTTFSLCLPGEFQVHP